MVRAVAGDEFLDHGPQNRRGQLHVGDVHGASIPPFPADERRLAGIVKRESWTATAI
jgi:hypothetical protein